jgi:1-acyl-sn-glycerol-3-phosphate acyltransferase
MDSVAQALRSLGISAVRFYNRLDVTVAQELPDEPVLFVANHGFGGIVDLNVFAFAAAYEKLATTREVITLTHQIAWTLRAGKLVEPFGARPAHRQSAIDAFSRGHNVLVFPGGDVDGLKSWTQRNQILFSGRTGFARLAIDADVPVVPVVTAGAGESLVVLSGGTRVAKALGLDKRLRLKALPLSVSLPWGINLGLVGILPYIPLPTKLATSIMTPMRPTSGESVEEFADRIHSAMQLKLDSLTKDRRPIVG